MSAHAIRTLQLSALIPLGLLLAALACIRVHQTSGQEWALWAAFLTLACGAMSAGYLIGHALPAHAPAHNAGGNKR